jgi:hypothetical protein
MIISASRVTDIPGLYSEWFMNRIRAGNCLVPSTRNPSDVAQVSLTLQDVDAIVFWSKDPRPLMPALDELDGRGYRYYFQFTLNDYPYELEPLNHTLEERLKTFLDLSRRIGPRRVVWRYDPIIISNRTPYDFHRETFSLLAKALEGATEHAVLSIMFMFGKLTPQLVDLEQHGFIFERAIVSSTGMTELLRDLASIAKEHHMEISLCSQAHDFTDFGFVPCRCIDDRLVNSLWGLALPYVKDPSMRRLCRCTASKDIGVGDTCINGCPYCYSVRNKEFARRRYEEHDPHSPALWFPSVRNESSP